MDTSKKGRLQRKIQLKTAIDINSTNLLNIDNTFLNDVNYDTDTMVKDLIGIKQQATSFGTNKSTDSIEYIQQVPSQSVLKEKMHNKFDDFDYIENEFDSPKSPKPSTSKQTLESPFLQKAKKLKQSSAMTQLFGPDQNNPDQTGLNENEFWIDSSFPEISQALNKTKYEKETTDLFDRVCTTIRKFGTQNILDNVIEKDQSESQIPCNGQQTTAMCVVDSSNLSMFGSDFLGDISTLQNPSGVVLESQANNIKNMEKATLDLDLLEKHLKSPEIIKRALDNAEKLVERNFGNDETTWTDETILANAVLNFSTTENIDNIFSNLIKKALQNNKEIVNEQEIPATSKVAPQKQYTVLGKFYGLPGKVMELIKLYKGIDELYEWQDECLNLPAIKNRKNLVYALPTSGGKTLVAEILILRELLCMNKNALFVLPYVSIVQEKVWALSPFAVALDFLIEEYAAGKGNYPPRKRRRKRSVYIATMEKALGILNSLIEMDRAGEIGLIVVDELHLLGDDSRGAVLEALLTKTKLIKENIQVVGMSATIGNLNDICQFLNADVYARNFRPVELIEYIKVDDELAKIDWNTKTEDELFIPVRKLNYNYSKEMLTLDPDLIGGLVMEVCPESSCLIFCPSKINCENVAKLLVKILPRSLLEHKRSEKNNLLRAIKLETDSLCPILESTIKCGIAYHHSGLTFEERRLLEEAYRQGILCVICCTSTLAAGVNLPAKRVILRKPYVGRDFINLSRYKQMVGRAGRAGLSDSNMGESIVICSSKDLNNMITLFRSPMDLALSSFSRDNNKGLRHFLLSCISLKLADSRASLQTVTRETLIYVQKERLQVDIKKLTDRSISDLFKLGALQIDGQLEKQLQSVSVNINTTQGLLSPTGTPNTSTSKSKLKTKLILNNHNKLLISKMGSAAIKSGFELSRAHLLYDDLLQAQTSLVLLDNLHLLYLVTPYDISEQMSPSRYLYSRFFNELGIKELQTAKIIGINEQVASKWLLNQRSTKDVPDRVLNRFYVTLMLHDLWNERSVFWVSNKFDVNRGLIQNLITSAATFASNVVHFCNEFEDFWPFVGLLKGIGQRLQHCCMKELIPLMDLPLVKQSRAKQLYINGYKNLQSIAKASSEELVQNIEYMTTKLANQLISAAKLILLEKVENLREEAEDVLDGANLG